MPVVVVYALKVIDVHNDSGIIGVLVGKSTFQPFENRVDHAAV